VTFPARWIEAKIDTMRMQPKPCAPIPIWIGGSSDAAIERALRLDGWHGSRVTAEQAPAVVQRLRAKRPGADFTVSVRAPYEKDMAAVRARLDAYKAAGIEHVLIAPEEREIDDYLRAVEAVARCTEGL
jgi:hypothetical protein